MTRGEIGKVAFALYKIAEVEEVINDVTVWDAIGPDGIENVHKLKDAINALANVLADHTERKI